MPYSIVLDTLETLDGSSIIEIKNLETGLASFSSKDSKFENLFQLSHHRLISTPTWDGCGYCRNLELLAQCQDWFQSKFSKQIAYRFVYWNIWFKTTSPYNIFILIGQKTVFICIIFITIIQYESICDTQPIVAESCSSLLFMQWNTLFLYK